MNAIHHHPHHPPLHPPRHAPHRLDHPLLPALPAGRAWLPVNTGESGDAVYRRSDGVAHAKLSTRRGAAQLEGERQRTAWLSGFRLGSPKVLDWITSDEGACLVTSTVAGVPASELPPAELLQAWPSMTHMLKALHALPAGDCPFDRGLATMFARAEDVVARHAVNPDFLDPEHQQVPAATLLAALQMRLPGRLAQEPQDRVVCHGDACLPNFMVDPSTLHCTGLIDLGRLGTADRYVDFSLLLGSARETWTEPNDAQRAHHRLFEAHDLAADAHRLDFYLRLDPLTWG